MHAKAGQGEVEESVSEPEQVLTQARVIRVGELCESVRVC